MGTGKGVVSYDFAKPWPADQAAAKIRAKLSDTREPFSWTSSYRPQLQEFGLYAGDILFVIKNGVVNEEGENSTLSEVFKYKMVAPTPNSNGRFVTVTVAVCERNNQIKVLNISLGEPDVESP